MATQMSTRSLLSRVSKSEFSRIQKEVELQFKEVSDFHKENGLSPIGSNGVPLYFRIDDSGEIFYRRVASSPSPIGQDGIVSEEGIAWFAR